jgi:hypothetical protein
MNGHVSIIHTTICYDKYATQTLLQDLEQSGWRIQDDVSGQRFTRRAQILQTPSNKARIVHSGQAELSTALK